MGKTTLMGQLQPDQPLFDLERQSDFSRISYDPEFFLYSEKSPIKIDEAQLLPTLFPALRVAIDKNRKQNGQYLISGSSSPELLSKITETLAGRVALFEVCGFSLAESYSKPVSEFYQAIIQNRPDDLLALKPRYTFEELSAHCLSGGYPEAVTSSDLRFKTLWFENYLETYVKRDVRTLFPGISSETFQRFVRMLATASGQQINFSTFARSLEVSQPTAKNYFRIAEGTFLWRYLESYHSSSMKRALKTPKGYLRDTGLLCHMLGISNISNLRAHPHFGYVWEIFVIEQIVKEFQNQLIKVTPSYYRTQDQAEVDLLLEGPFGLVPIEIKAGMKTELRHLRSLQSFVEQNACPFGLVVNNSLNPSYLSRNIIQIPAGCL
ncbi:MAG: ATP-binding protein [Myxococcaceae bacterium]|nr:ATP-binding protein [Myxococcaceae bacterium]MBH2006638.1 ATP-binding protein [Myxococcaceae bacterium]